MVVAADADLNFRNATDDTTPLELAAGSDQVDVMAMMLQKGEAICSTKFDGSTILRPARTNSGQYVHSWGLA